MNVSEQDHAYSSKQSQIISKAAILFSPYNGLSNATEYTWVDIEVVPPIQKRKHLNLSTGASSVPDAVF